MSIFKRNEPGDAQQTATQTAPEPAAAAVKHETPAKPMPPFVSPEATPRRPGVVPPPAAPMYSMRPPEAAVRFEMEAESSTPATMSAPSETVPQRAQESVQKRVAVAVEAARTVAPAAPRARARAALPAAPAMHPHQGFDPVRAIQAGLLNVAWKWQEAGAPIRAIHAYMELLIRYPDTPAADAAIADLMALSEKLAREGQFHTALAIYDRLEHLM